MESGMEHSVPEGCVNVVYSWSDVTFVTNYLAVFVTICTFAALININIITYEKKSDDARSRPLLPKDVIAAYGWFYSLGYGTGEVRVGQAQR